MHIILIHADKASDKTHIYDKKKTFRKLEIEGEVSIS